MRRLTFVLGMLGGLVSSGGSDPFANREAEEWVAGALLIAAPEHAEAVGRVRGMLDAGMFSRPELGAAFEACGRLRDRGDVVDVVTVAEELRRSGALNGTDPHAVAASLVDAVPTAANVEHHARIVLEKAQRRQVRAALETALRDLSEANGAELHEVVAAHRTKLEGLAPGGGTFPAPESPRAILESPEEEEEQLAVGILPAAANILIVGYPKSLKTLGYFDLAVAAALGDKWLHRFPIERPRRVGIVLMEGRKRHAAHKLDRLAQSRGMRASDLEGLVHMWHRPPLRFNDARAMAGLTTWAKDLGLDDLIVDAWSYVAGLGTDSHRDHEVLDQLQAFGAIRDEVKGLTTILVHHARKEQADRAGHRLTDLIRGSGGFGQWYDAGLAFHRRDEQSPVTVRTEFRERPAREEFVFSADDQEPGTSSNDWTPQGWLRLKVLDESPKVIARRQRAEEKLEDVLAYLRANPGMSVRKIREGIGGSNPDIEAAVELGKQRNLIVVELAEGPGKAHRHFLSGGYRA